MAIVSLNYYGPGPFLSGGWDKLWRRTYDLKYKVLCDSRLDGPTTLRLGADPVTGMRLPRIGNSFFLTMSEYDAGSYLESVDYQQESAGASPDHTQWAVTCHYGPYDATIFSQNPIDWPVKLSFSAQHFDRIVYVDQAGNQIVNSAGIPFNDAIVIDDSRPIITVVRNELLSTFDPTLADRYRDKTNSDYWNGFGPKIVKCNSITTSDPQLDTNSGAWFYAVTYVFEFNRDTWTRQILDQGFMKRFPSGSSTIIPISQKGQPITEPMLLDGTGSVLASGASPVVLPFDVYPSVPFSAFNISFAAALGH